MTFITWYLIYTVIQTLLVMKFGGMRSLDVPPLFTFLFLSILAPVTSVFLLVPLGNHALKWWME